MPTPRSGRNWGAVGWASGRRTGRPRARREDPWEKAFGPERWLTVPTEPSRRIAKALVKD